MEDNWENLFYRITRLFAAIAVSSLLFVLTSIPVITMGCSLTGLCGCMQEIVKRGCGETELTKTFFANFKKKIRQSTFTWLICLMAVAFLTLYYIAVRNMTEFFGSIYGIIFCILIIIFMLVFQFIFPLTAAYDFSIRTNFMLSWMMALALLPRTLCSALVPALIIFAMLYLPVYIPAIVPACIILGPGLAAYLNARLLKKGLDMCEKEGS